MLDAKYMELHLGILQNRYQQLKQDKGRAEATSSHLETQILCLKGKPDNEATPDVEPAKKDKELVDLEIKALEKKLDKAKKELVKYEDEVLKLTTLC